MASEYLQSTNSTYPSDQDLSQRVAFERLEDRRRWCAEQRFVVDWFESMSPDGRTLRPGVAMDALIALIGFIHKLEATADKTDFRYRIYGSRVARLANVDMTGRSVSDMKAIHRAAFLGHYRALAENPELFVGRLLLFGEGILMPEWFRVDMPVGPSADDVSGLLVLAMPVSVINSFSGTS